MDLALIIQDANTIGVLRFFAALFFILCLYGGAWGFTYWISKDE